MWLGCSTAFAGACLQAILLCGLNPPGPPSSLRPMSPRHRPPFESFVAPARSHISLWRLALGLALAALIYALWSALVLTGYWWLAGPDQSAGWMRDVQNATSPRHTYVLLSTFLGMVFGVMVAARFIHQRPIGTLFGRAPVVLHDFVIAAGVVGLVYAVSIGLWIIRFDAIPQVDPKLWLLLLPLSLLGVAIQTGAEELVFRGYLQQQLAARFRSPLMWLVLPSLLFGLAHYDPDSAGGNLWFVVAATTLFGLTAADLTARTGSLGAAWGFHFANNIAALMIVAVKGTIPGLALFTTPYSADDPVMTGLIVTDMAALLIAWFLLRRILQR